MDVCLGTMLNTVTMSSSVKIDRELSYKRAPPPPTDISADGGTNGSHLCRWSAGLLCDCSGIRVVFLQLQHSLGKPFERLCRLLQHEISEQVLHQPVDPLLL